MKKTAIILMNLGGPDSLDAVQPFLFNLFNDKAIIRLPRPLRYFIAKLISSRRNETAKEIYARMGGRSPILPNTQAQADALETYFADNASDPSQNVRCFVAMRYWHPFTEETAQQAKNYNPDNIVLLPLYPQFSTTTTASSVAVWHKVAKKIGLNTPTKTIGCYPTEDGFIRTVADATRKAYDTAKKYGTPRILFSAHGLPEKIVASGDPYQAQCEMTTAALVATLNIPNLDYTLCYQSRVGPMRWITPSTDTEVDRAGADKIPVVMVPIAFVSEHSETLVELDIEYRHRAETCGVPHYAYVPTVGDNPAFIASLARLVTAAQNDPLPVMAGNSKPLCPQGFSGCICRAIP